MENLCRYSNKSLIYSNWNTVKSPNILSETEKMSISTFPIIGPR